MIQGHVSIGPGCRLLGHVYLNGPLTMGANNTLYPYVCAGFEPQHLRYDGGTAGVVMGDRNILREMAVIHSSMRSDRPTQIGNDNFIMTNAHVGHDVQVANHCTLASGVLLAGHASVEDHVTLGGNAAVHQNCRLGRLAFLGGGVVATKDVPPFMLCKVDDQVIGVNLVGLRRGGIDRAAIDSVRSAFRILYLSSHSNPVAADRIEQAAGQGVPGAELLLELARFIRTNRRGLSSFSGRRRKNQDLDSDS